MLPSGGRNELCKSKFSTAVLFFSGERFGVTSPALSPHKKIAANNLENPGSGTGAELTAGYWRTNLKCASIWVFSPKSFHHFDPKNKKYESPFGYSYSFLYCVLSLVVGELFLQGAVASMFMLSSCLIVRFLFGVSLRTFLIILAILEFFFFVLQKGQQAKRQSNLPPTQQEQNKNQPESPKV